MQVDVQDPVALRAFAERVVERLGPIDLWINNAGVLKPIGFLRDIDAGAFSDHIQTNVLGVMHGMQTYIRHVRSRGDSSGGVLVNISSGAAKNGYAGWSAYCSGKAAVDLMTESAHLEESQSGLRLYSVAPGIIDTDMQEMIRGCSKEQFPMVQKFLDVKKEDAFNSPEHVARSILAAAFDPSKKPDKVIWSIPAERPRL